MWTSANYIPFLGITAHWISKEWELVEILVDFYKLNGTHSGENLAESFINCCNEFKILTKVCIYFLIFLKFNLQL